MGRSETKYPGVLGKLFPSLEPDLERAFESRGDADEVLARRELDVETKLLLLQEYFEIPETLPEGDRWHALALCLAERHVPGLREAKRRGPKTKWTDFRRAELRLAVDAKLNGGTKGVPRALSILAKEDPWKTILIRNRREGGRKEDPAEALRKQYNAAKPEVVNLLQENRKNFLAKFFPRK